MASRYSDISTQFIQHPVSGDVSRIVDFEAVRRSIRNLILTDKYERLLDPNIGSNINRVLFEPMDAATATVLQNYIREAIKNYEPRAKLEDVQVIPDYDRNSYVVTIYFSVIFSEEIQTVEFFLTRIR
jgi:phage baseplate assembly protein W